MFQKIIIFLLIFLFIILEISVFPNFFSERQIPEMMLILVIFWTIREGFEKSIVRTILAGMISDIARSGILGLHIVSLIIVSFIIGYLAKRYLVLQKMWRGIGAVSFVVLGLFMYMFISSFLAEVYAYLRINDGEYNFQFIMDYALFWKIVFTVVFFVAFYGPLRKIETILAAYNQRILNQNKVFQRR